MQIFDRHEAKKPLFDSYIALSIVMYVAGVSLLACLYVLDLKIVSMSFVVTNSVRALLEGLTEYVVVAVNFIVAIELADWTQVLRVISKECQLWI